MVDPQPPLALQFERLRFAWPGQSSPCLDIPEFEARSGERIFLYGPSGSGKSTLLSLVGGVAVPQGGDVRVLGTSLSGLSRAARDRFRGDHVGFIFQQFNLIPCLSALQNVLLPAGFSKRRAQRAAARGGSVRAEAQRLLHSLDLAPDWWHRPTTELSVGQQQRVAAARALLGSPELLIADEPTSALDTARCEAFLKLLLQECEQAGTCVLFVSHDERLVPHFTRRVSLPEINRAAGDGLVGGSGLTTQAGFAASVGMQS